VPVRAENVQRKVLGRISDSTAWVSSRRRHALVLGKLTCGVGRYVSTVTSVADRSQGDAWRSQIHAPNGFHSSNNDVRSQRPSKRYVVRAAKHAAVRGEITGPSSIVRVRGC
jgi:hypothetical protein